MIIRIVKMSFAPEKVNEFLQLFDSSKQQIRNFEGCRHLELLKEANQKNIFFTYSYWENESDLEHYRNSALFAGVWANTKILFNDKPQAWSLVQHTLVT
ncbi:MAG: antibiotic biosynthesis monooxygenase [Bacteroidetes bacterium]|nr:antibiotic biosynthesis monooxygenase [Bacteroidota bacterium]